MDAQRIRRTCGVLGVLGLVVLGVTSSVLGWFETCQGVVAQVGDRAVVERCGPLAPTDLPVIALAVVVALAFAPDVGELGLFGLVSWKRKVDEAAAQQSDLALRVADLRVAVAQNQAQTVTVNVEGPIDRAALRDELSSALTRLDQKERELDG